MLVGSALAAQIVNAVVPPTSTPEQRGQALDAWTKIATALVSYLQANTEILVMGQTAPVATVGSPAAQSGTAIVAPTTVHGIM
jgi:hypothetical protein